MQFTSPHIPAIHALKLFWDRVTFSRLTKIYFAFSVLHCIVQVVFQVQAFIANADAAQFLGGLIVQGNATDPGFAVYEGGDLRMCDTVPTTVLDVSSCLQVWDGHTAANSTLIPGANDAANVSMSSASVVSSTTSLTLSSASSSAISIVSANVTASAAGSSTATASSSVTASSVAASSSPAASSSTAAASTSLAASSSSSSSILSSSTARSSSVISSAVSSQPPTSASSSAKATSQSFHATASAEITLVTSRAVHTVTVTKTASSSSASVGASAQNTGDDSDDDDDDEIDDSDDEDDLFASHHFESRDIVLPETQIRLALNGSTTVNLGGLYGKDEMELPRKCLYVLNWPVDTVQNTKREDIAFIAFQIWLLGMSLVALLNESIPHIAASLLTHILATAWGGFQIFNTEQFHREFTLLTTQGACGINLLPSYWKARSNAEIPSLALNAFALCVSTFLSWRLMKTFGWQTFKRVGASRTINRVYNMVLLLSIAIQLALFFVGASAALWLDQVFNGNIGRLTHQPTFFKAVMITVLVLLIPWLSTGWISVRKEYRIRMMIFLIIAVLVLAGWAFMFIAATFRWTYVTWLFFALMTTAAVVLTVTVLVLGIACRINFGKGLSRYLNAHEELTDDNYQSPVKTYDSEKIDFPSNDSPVPTFSVTFGSGADVPPPSQMRFAPRHMGPRFNSGTTFSSANPFDTPADTVRSDSVSLSRQTSLSSQMSHSSADSANSAGSTGSKSGKRWVIE